jgi:hypothetical protein
VAARRPLAALVAGARQNQACSAHQGVNATPAHSEALAAQRRPNLADAPDRELLHHGLGRGRELVGTDTARLFAGRQRPPAEGAPRARRPTGRPKAGRAAAERARRGPRPRRGGPRTPAGGRPGAQRRGAPMRVFGLSWGRRGRRRGARLGRRG